MEKFIQNTNKLMNKFNSLSKVVEFVAEELSPKVFGEENLEKLNELSKKIVDEIVKL
ncbi:MAG: hypothetical protein GY870_10730 [archaeon]|nr:hypothetical protein [archaeon]